MRSARRDRGRMPPAGWRPPPGRRSGGQPGWPTLYRTWSSQMRDSTRARPDARTSRPGSMCLVAWALVLGLAVSAWSARAARADGDPASDVLATQTLFLPQDAGLSASHQVQLERLLQETASAGFPLRVAVIASATDLGSVTELWREPATYARFLGEELSLTYR